MKAKETILIMVMVIGGTVSAATVTVELPELIGGLQPYPNHPTSAFDLGTSFLKIDEVRIQISGTFTLGLARSMITGESWELTPEIELYMDPGVGSCYTFIHPLESPFDVKDILQLKNDATWDFLLDGKSQVSVYLGWGGAIPEINITAGSVQISGAHITVEGIIPEPATLLLLGLGGLMFVTYEGSPMIVWASTKNIEKKFF